MKNEPAPVAGRTKYEQAVRLAGVLAEIGVTRVQANAPDGSDFELVARRTDLPGLIQSGRVAALRCEQIGLTAEISDVILVRCDRAEVLSNLTGDRRGGARG